MNQIVIEDPNIEMKEVKDLLVAVIDENKRLHVIINHYHYHYHIITIITTITITIITTIAITIIITIIIIIHRNIIDKMMIDIRKK